MVCEPFTQWVLEDAFTAGRPPFEDAGVQVVDDVEPYELMKLRLLNASHQALCYFGYLAGYRLVHEAAQDPLFARLPARLHGRGGTPTLAPVPGIDLDEYKHTLIERFSNPEVRDTVARLCAESSDRIPKWLLPVDPPQPRDAAARSAARPRSWPAGRATPRASTSRASRSRWSTGSRTRSCAIARRQREDPTAFIANRELFGDLVDDERFVAAYRAALDSLHERGARATLEEIA